MAEMLANGHWVPCVLLEVSASGAKLHVGHDMALPAETLLKLPDGQLREAHCRWQHGAYAGFEFASLLPGIPFS
ncbi:hypothetical protein J8J14_24445 [Roseomonas sp. SSH11]|uniref:PilZ domain-containing protein n=2 Tax=Pararoseomonas baculiformis TaxID=2820812 RepID=A0ABS4ALK2_9PROT|nr:hypothetical protein [Pararoseomonas baculiformis]